MQRRRQRQMCIRDRDDRPALHSSGIRAIFGPGTPTEEILEFISIAYDMTDVGVGADSDWHWQSTA